MVLHAAHRAAQPNSSLKAPSVAVPSFGTRRYAMPFRVLDAVLPRIGFSADDGCGWWSMCIARNRWGDFGAYGCLPFVSRPLLGSRFGPILRPAAGSLFCFALRGPPGYGFQLRPDPP